MELELDVVASTGRSVLALGEAKWSAAPVGRGILGRLERKRALLGERAARAKLLLFSSAGFDRGLAAHARGRQDVELVDLRRLYTGD